MAVTSATNPTTEISVATEWCNRTWTILRDGKSVATGQSPALVCLPQGTTTLTVPVSAADLPPTAEYHLNVEFARTAETLWAKPGQVVARDPFALPWGRRAVSGHTCKTPANAQSGEATQTITGPGFKAVFDNQHGTLTSYQVAGRE